MSNKVFISLIALIVIGTFGFIVVNKKNNPPAERPGTAQKDLGRQHVQGIESKPNVGAEPPTSGDHAFQPLPWQAYEQEIPDGSAIHNLEHGGIYVSYRPDLPKDQIDKMKALFFKPFSEDNFTPNKVIMAPRALNESPIVLSSWTRSMEFENFDAEKMEQYYRRNTGKSPEPTAL